MDFFNEPFFLHMFMDGNIAPNIGDSDVKVLQNFDKYIVSGFDAFRDIEELFKMTGHFNVKKVFYTKDELMESIENINKDNSDQPSIINEICKTNIPDLSNFRHELIKLINNEYNTHNTASANNNVKKIIIKFNILATVEMIVRNIINNNTQYLLTSGWISSTGSHLIGLYFVKNKDDNYTTLIVNSGSGIQYHKKNNDGKIKIICEKNDVTAQQLKQILTISIMGQLKDTTVNMREKYDNVSDNINNLNDNINDLLDRYHIADINSAHDFYENMTKVFHRNNFDEIVFSDGDVFYAEPQLSGSCTYYGIYYFLLYYAYKKNQLNNFLEYYKGLKNKYAQHFVDKIDVNEYISDKDFSLAYFFYEKYNVDITSIRKKYMTSLEHTSSETNIKNNYVDGKVIVNNLLPLENIINELKHSDNVLSFMKSFCYVINNYAINTIILRKPPRYSDILVNILNKLIVLANDRETAFYNIDRANVDDLLLYSLIFIKEHTKMFGRKNEFFVCANVFNIVMKSIENFNIITPDIEPYADINVKNNTHILYELVYDNYTSVIKKYASYLDRNIGLAKKLRPMQTILLNNLPQLLEKWNLYEDSTRLMLFYLFYYFCTNKCFCNFLSIDSVAAKKTHSLFKNLKIFSDVSVKNYQYQKIKLSTPTCFITLEESVKNTISYNGVMVNTDYSFELLPGEYIINGKYKSLPTRDIITNRELLGKIESEYDILYEYKNKPDAVQLDVINIELLIVNIKNKNIDAVNKIINLNNSRKFNSLTSAQTPVLPNYQQQFEFYFSDGVLYNYIDHSDYYYYNIKILENLSIDDIIVNYEKMTLETFLFFIMLLISNKYVLEAYGIKTKHHFVRDDLTRIIEKYMQEVRGKNKSKNENENIYLCILKFISYFTSENPNIDYFRSFIYNKCTTSDDSGNKRSYIELSESIYYNYIYLNPHLLNMLISENYSDTVTKLSKKHPGSKIISSIVNIGSNNYKVHTVITNKNSKITYLDETYIHNINPVFKNFASSYVLENNVVTIDPIPDSSVYEKIVNIKFIINDNDIVCVKDNDKYMTKNEIRMGKYSGKIANILKLIDGYIIWCTQNGKVISIDFPMYKCQDIHNTYPQIIYDVDSNELYYMQADDVHKIVIDIPLYNKFTHDIENSLIIEKDNNFQILLMSYLNDDLEKKVDSIIESPWLNIEKQPSGNKNNIRDDIILNIHGLNAFYTIDIHYTGLFLKISDENAFYFYFLLCNIYQKMNIIDTLYENASLFMTSNKIKNLLKYPNTPYNFYYDVKYEFLYGTRSYMETMYEGSTGITDLISRENFYINKYKYKKPSYGTLNIDIRNNFVNFVELLNKNNQLEKINFDSSDEFDFHNSIKKYLAGYSNDKSNGEYIKCRFDKDKIDKAKLMTNIIKCSKNFTDKISKYYERIGNINACAYSSNEIITEHHNLFYSLLKYIKINNICKNLIKIDEPNACDKSLMISGIIDNYYVYSGNRRYPIIIFEILFGNFIRDDQYNVYDRIVNELHKNNQYNIYQMLMGKGKTSVITPLLVFEYIFGKKFKNIVIVLPKHLIRQTHEMISSKYSCIMPFTKVIKMEITRETNKTTIEDYFNYSIGSKNIIITDLPSLQSIRLNYVESSLTNNFALGLPFNLGETLFIFDEIDSVSDPLSNELNYPESKKSITLEDEFSRQIIVDIAYILMTEEKIVVPLLDDTLRKTLIKKCMSRSLERIIDNFKVLNKVRIEYLKRKISSIYDTVLQKIYNKDYGFHDGFIAIPYAYVNTPLIGSEFTDKELKITFTTMSYFIQGLRTADITHIKERLTKIYRENKDFPFLLKNNSLIKMLEINITGTETQSFFEEIEIDRNNFMFIREYLNNEILPKYIKSYSEQYNASFIDIAGNTFSKYKIGFSGTVSGIHIDILSQDVNKNNIFGSVEHDEVAMGAIYSALTGATQKEPPKIHVFDHEKNMLSNIIDLIVDNEYDSLIDTGALLRNYDSLEVINEIRTKYNNHQTYIYIDEKDKLQYVTNNDYKGKSNMFIYYDQKHTVGIDVQNQPYILKGLITINYFNRFTDISQGIYRLRKMNYGHSVDYVICNISHVITSPNALVKYLLYQDKTYRNDNESSAVLQQIKYINRKTNSKFYLDTVFDEINYIHKQKDLDKNNYLKYVRDKYCNETTIISKLCKRLGSLKNNLLQINANVEQQTSLNVEANVNVQTALARNINNIQIKITNNNYSWYIKNYFTPDEFSAYRYLEEKISSVLVKFLNKHKIYLSPKMFSDVFDPLGLTLDRMFETNLANTYNYYSMETDNGYILIKGFEYTVLSNFLRERPNNIIIRDKNNNVVFGNNKKPANMYPLTIIKYMLGGDVNFIESIIFVEELTKNQPVGEIINFMNIIESFLLNIYTNDNVHLLLRSFLESKRSFRDYIEGVFNSEIELPQLLNIDREHKKLLKNAYNALASVNIPGCKKEDYKYLYNKYSHKYNHLMNKTSNS